MSKRVRSLAAVAITVVTTTGLVAVAAGRYGSEIPISVTVADKAIQAGMLWDLRIGSDGGGAYVTTSTTSAVLQPLATGNDLMLYTYYSKRGGFAPSGRGLRIDLSEQDTGDASTTPVLAPTVPIHLKVSCSSANIDMLRIGLNQTVTCPGGLRFWQLTGASSGNWYRLSFQPANYPEADPFSVTCDLVEGGSCRRWSITPSGGRITPTDPLPKNYTRLLAIDDQGLVLDELGTYFVSFSISVSR